MYKIANTKYTPHRYLNRSFHLMFYILISDLLQFTWNDRFEFQIDILLWSIHDNELRYNILASNNHQTMAERKWTLEYKELGVKKLFILGECTSYVKLTNWRKVTFDIHYYFHCKQFRHKYIENLFWLLI